MIFSSPLSESLAQGEEDTECSKELAQGLEVLHGATGSNLIDYDIVAVPGLGADPDECWSWPHKSTTVPKQRGLPAKDYKFNWLRDANGLRAQQPQARIMLYKYTSAWNGKFTVNSSLHDLAEALLIGLREKRMSESARKRPIIFIGHSMGGLVIAKALCLANANPSDFAGIVPYVTACSFFGTPFQGSQFAQLALIYGDVKNYFFSGTVPTELLRLMEPGNDELYELVSDFGILARQMDPKIRLLCFYESFSFDWCGLVEKKTSIRFPNMVTEASKELLGKRGAHFVTKQSAVLPGSESLPLDTNHRDLIRFTGPSDGKFDIVVGCISRFGSEAIKDLRQRHREVGIDDTKIASIRRLLESIVPMRVKLNKSPKDSEVDTWLVAQSMFQKWRRQSEDSRSCLWIDGPPGYGKTTASISATRHVECMIQEDQQHNHSRTEMTLWACFFCDAQPYCSTAEDLLKSILLQLIEQYPQLAVYAKNFLSKETQVDDGLDQSQTQRHQGSIQRSNTVCSRFSNQTKATMTIEHLWQCLQEALQDGSLHTVYIIVSNIHKLDRNESLAKLLELIRTDVTCRKPTQADKLPIKQGRWLFTSYSKGRDDISRCMRDGDIDSNVDQMNLKEEAHRANLKLALTQHIRRKSHDLGILRGYDQSFVFEIEKIIDSKADDMRWVDIMFIQLEALPESCDRLVIRSRLDAAAPGDIRRLVEDAWQWVFMSMKPELECKVKDVLRGLVLLHRKVTIRELAVLTGYSLQDLESFIEACKPLLSINGVEQNITFADELIKKYLLLAWNNLLTSSVSSASQEEVERQIVRQHGYLTWKCFMHLDKTLSPKGTSITDKSLTRVKSLARGTDAQRSLQRVITDQLAQDADDGIQHDLSNAQNPPLTYPVECWKHHALAGEQYMAQSLCIDMSGFWEEDSFLRQEWLEAYVRIKPELNDFEDLEIKQMTALHVTSALGLHRLTLSLLDTDYAKDIEAQDSNQYTPLHLAAFNNRLDIVRLLLDRGAKIEASDSVASPLHLAAVRGHVNVMQELLKSKCKYIADANAKCGLYGSVINAAIRSGVSNGVKELLKLKKLDNLDLKIDKADSPLVLAATISNSSLFQELLDVGKDTWEEDHYEEAMVAASQSGKVECVNALIRCGHCFTKRCLQTSIIRAGAADNWEVVTALLNHDDFADEPSDYYNIFFLAAATKHDRDKLLEKIKHLAKRTIPQETKHLTEPIIPQEILDAALYRATDNQKTTTVRWLLEQCQASPNATSDRPIELDQDCFKRLNEDSYGDALSAAAYDGSFDIVQILLDNRARVDSEDGAALQTAAKQGYLNIVDLLLKKGADIDRVLEIDLMSKLKMNDYPGTALQIACDSNQPAVVKLLLERGANPNLSHPESKFTRPILSATQNKRPEILEYLLEDKRTEVNVQGGPKRNYPLHSACEGMILDSVEHLVTRGAEINAIDSLGNQPIHMAASHGNIEVLKYLLTLNANVTHCGQDMGLALQEALKQKHLECGSLLADAIAPILESLVTAASKNNQFAQSVIQNPRGQHPHIDTELFERLLKENISLRERNNSIELTLNDYEAMNRRVEEYKNIAIHEEQVAKNAKVELEAVHRRYDCSIEGYDAVNRERNSLRKELAEARAENVGQQDAARARLENEVACLRQQLQARSEESEKQQKKLAEELYVFQYALQCEKLRADDLEKHVWKSHQSDQALRPESNPANLARHSTTTSVSSNDGMSETEAGSRTTSRFSFGEDSDRVYSTSTSSTSDIDPAESATRIKRKKPRTPLMKIAGDFHQANKGRWKTMADATQTQVASASLSTKTAFEDMAEKTKAMSFQKKTSVSSI